MKVIWQPKALKQLKKVGDRAIQERILTATRELSAFPACPNVKPLVNHEYGAIGCGSATGVYCSMRSRKSALSALRR
jgi:hypothetical protein